MYWMVFRSRAPLSANVYDPLEESFPAFADPAKCGGFQGGFGLIMIIRYKDTPLGPYNEMVYIPGDFEIPTLRRKGARVTRIYVDQKETTYNGTVINFVFTMLSNP